jgi:predicted GIY-YIG superfamily endonuclease
VHFVYIVRCADGTLYTGYARDPQARAAAHSRGRGARYTAGRGPVTLVYTERCRSVGAALRREYEVKCLSRRAKQALIAMRPKTGRLKPAPPGRLRAPRRPRAAN